MKSSGDFNNTWKSLQKQFNFLHTCVCAAMIDDDDFSSVIVRRSTSSDLPDWKKKEKKKIHTKYVASSRWFL